MSKATQYRACVSTRFTPSGLKVRAAIFSSSPGSAFDASRCVVKPPIAASARMPLPSEVSTQPTSCSEPSGNRRQMRCITGLVSAAAIAFRRSGVRLFTMAAPRSSCAARAACSSRGSTTVAVAKLASSDDSTSAKFSIEVTAPRLTKMPSPLSTTIHPATFVMLSRVAPAHTMRALRPDTFASRSDSVFTVAPPIARLPTAPCSCLVQSVFGSGAKAI